MIGLPKKLSNQLEYYAPINNFFMIIQPIRRITIEVTNAAVLLVIHHFPPLFSLKSPFLIVVPFGRMFADE